MGHLILGLLCIAPQTLYTLTKQFEEGISLFYSASLGSIRAALTRLVERGLIDSTSEVENGRNKKTYVITPAGREAFRTWMLSPIESGNVEVVALSKLYSLGLLADPAERRAVLERVAQRIRSDEAQLQRLATQLDSTEVPAEFEQIVRYRRLTLDYGLRSFDTANAFFDQLRAAEGA